MGGMETDTVRKYLKYLTVTGSESKGEPVTTRVAKTEPSREASKPRTNPVGR